MEKFWREYGLVAVLLIVAVGGYLSLGDQREDFLSDPLNAIEQRFSGLMADDAARAELAQEYEVFRQKVRDGEIDPEQVESVAASALNLQASGATLTSEDIGMMFSLATESDAFDFPIPSIGSGPSADTPEGTGGTGTSAAREPSQPADPVNPTSPSVGPAPRPPAPPRAKRPMSPERAKELNDRVAYAFALADGLESASREEQESTGTSSLYRFIVRDGLTVVVDSGTANVWSSDRVKPLTRDLERRNMVIYDQEVQNRQDRRVHDFERQIEAIQQAREARLIQSEQERLITSMTRLQKLREMGMVVEFDTTRFRQQLELQLQSILGDLKVFQEKNTAEQVRVEVNSGDSDN